MVILPWLRKFLKESIVLTVLSIIIGILATWYFTDRAETTTIKQAISDNAPKIDINTGVILDDHKVKYSYSTDSSKDTYSTGAGNIVLASLHATDSKGRELPIMNTPAQFTATGEIIVDASGAEDQVVLKVKCEGNSSIDPTRGIPCIPKGVKTELSVKIPNLNGIKIVGVDSTFAEDNKYPLFSDKIDLLNSKRIFKAEGALHYIVQSINAVTIDNGRVYKDKRKVGFLFFNNQNTSDTSINTISLKKDLEEIYKGHLDSFELYSFKDIQNDLNIKNEGGIIRHLLGIMGDCNLKEYGYCSLELEIGKKQLFSIDMITQNKIDYLYIVPINESSIVKKY